MVYKDDVSILEEFPIILELYDQFNPAGKAYIGHNARICLN
jgi:hypothetical protein